MSYAAPSQSSGSATFTVGTEAAFLAHLEKQSDRRRSAADTHEDIAWLTGDHAPPSEQKHFSRRNYVRKTFTYDAATGLLETLPKADRGMRRRVVPTEDIMSVVEYTHTMLNHAGWDATWDAVKKDYYGILRGDVNFLLKRCVRCSNDPRKRPKGAHRPPSDNSPAAGYSGGAQSLPSLAQYHAEIGYHQGEADFEQHEQYPAYQHPDSPGH